MDISYWVCAGITVISAAVSFGYSLAGLRTSDAPSKTASRYAFSRSVALLAVALTALFAGSVGFVAAAAIAMVLVQTIDAVIGAGIHDRLKTYGPALTALFNLAALVWMLVA
ncbi:hypothetical protein [Brevibacterium oceani]|uniref:hypothetical protein n=1 Tax=Brevibacterium oceani TaxID=358099 RepID=UPI001FE479C5|nr:hypothetical protein [Brevibacterium oceani]